MSQEKILLIFFKNMFIFPLGALIVPILTLFIGAYILNFIIVRLGGKKDYTGAFVSLFLAGLFVILINNYILEKIGNDIIESMIIILLLFGALFQMSLSYLHQKKKKTFIAISIATILIFILNDVLRAIVLLYLF